MIVQEILSSVGHALLIICQLIYFYLEAFYRQIVKPEMKSIDGHTILVTGACGGIGTQICRSIISGGSNIKLILWDLHKTDLEKLAAELKTKGNASGLKVYPFAVDISSRENIDACAQQVKDEVGPVSIVFNNAGIAPSGNFLQLSNENIEQTIQVNLMSHFWIIRQFLPDMVARNHGHIVNICSMGGLRAALHAFPYFAAKFGVNGYTEALKLELAVLKYDGIHVSTVYPYFVQTPMIRSLEVNKTTSFPLPMAFRQFLKPEDVAKKTVDGMRRNYEYIYCPSSIPLVCLLDYIFPLKFRKYIESAHATSYSFSNPEEQKGFDMPYHIERRNASTNKKGN